MNKELTEIIPGTEDVLETPAVIDETSVQPDASVTPAPIELPEQRFEYQPTDESGRPIGGKQVIKYRTPDELSAKLVEQNTLLLRKLRTETRNNRLGIAPQENIEEDAPRFQKPVTFGAKELTEDEKATLAIRLGISPDEFDTTTDELFELKFGVKPSVLSETLQEIQQERIAAKAQAEVAAFMAETPEYVKCQENFEAMTNWMLRYDLAPVRKNFRKAFDTLSAAGILIENITPEPVEEPVIEPAVEQQPDPVEEAHIEEHVVETPPPPPPASKPVSRVPLSLNRNNADEGTGLPIPAAGSDIVYEVVVNPKTGEKRRFSGLAAIQAMPADEYRRRVMTDPNFVKKEAALEKEAADRRKARR